jgi:hypothetical protein
MSNEKPKKKKKIRTGQVIVEDRKVIIDNIEYAILKPITIKELNLPNNNAYFHGLFDFCIDFCKSGGLIKTVQTPFHKGGSYLYYGKSGIFDSLLVIDKNNIVIKVDVGYNEKYSQSYYVGHSLNYDDLIFGHRDNLFCEFLTAMEYHISKHIKIRNSGIK